MFNPLRQHHQSSDDTALLSSSIPSPRCSNANKPRIPPANWGDFRGIRSRLFSFIVEQLSSQARSAVVGPLLCHYSNGPFFSKRNASQVPERAWRFRPQQLRTSKQRCSQRHTRTPRTARDGVCGPCRDIRTIPAKTTDRRIGRIRSWGGVPPSCGD